MYIRISFIYGLMLILILFLFSQLQKKHIQFVSFISCILQTIHYLLKHKHFIIVNENILFYLTDKIFKLFIIYLILMNFVVYIRQYHHYGCFKHLDNCINDILIFQWLDAEIFLYLSSVVMQCFMILFKLCQTYLKIFYYKQLLPYFKNFYIVAIMLICFACLHIRSIFEGIQASQIEFLTK